jgi:hypothetical protein
MIIYIYTHVQEEQICRNTLSQYKCREAYRAAYPKSATQRKAMTDATASVISPPTTETAINSMWMPKACQLYEKKGCDFVVEFTLLQEKANVWKELIAKCVYMLYAHMHVCVQTLHWYWRRPMYGRCSCWKRDMPQMNIHLYTYT